jgi:hypothetical protein
MSTHAGPLMLDVTRLVKKPPTRVAVGNSLVELRRVGYALAGFLPVLPITVLLFKFGFPTAAILTMFTGIGGGLLLSVARPDGQSLPQYVSGAMRGRTFSTVTDDDGNTGKVYVGICRVADYHDTTSFRLLHSAVDVNPDMLDRRGAFKK